MIIYTHTHTHTHTGARWRTDLPGQLWKHEERMGTDQGRKRRAWGRGRRGRPGNPLAEPGRTDPVPPRGAWPASSLLLALRGLVAPRSGAQQMPGPC